MPLPDRYASEPTVEVDRDKYQAWRNAEDAAKGWRAHADALKKELQETAGDSHALTVNGVKVATYRPTEGYATKSLIRDYPDLTQHYLRTTEVQELDVDTFSVQHGDILEKYRIRQFRAVEE